MKEKVLEISNLTFGYTKEKLIYKEFSLELFRGEIISVVGPSGSGKSTLFELITKNIKPIEGSIETFNISSIYQDPYSSFHNSYSIYNQIKDVCKDMKELKSFLSELSLDESLLEKKPFELSGGQLQRCSILRAILMKPDLLLADEPTSALDNIIALDVMKLLLKYIDRFGILLITHDENLATWCSDSILDIGEKN
jgi:peptide/nickel transport system ATP-binding protein